MYYQRLMGYSICADELLESGESITRGEYKTTFNYDKVYKPILGTGIGDYLSGKKVSDTKTTLSSLVNKLGTKTDADGWAPTPGNAGLAAQDLLDMSNKYPNAVWVVYG